MPLRNILATAALASVLAVPAFAQTPVAPPASPLATTPATGVMTTTDLFFNDVLLPTHWRASEAMGKAVYNRAGERIGEVDELLIDGSGRVVAAVVGVGGFLGIGERKVAVTYRSFEMTRESNGNPRLLIDLTRETLKSAPEYKSTAPARS